MYLRGLRQDVVRAAKAIAAREGMTLTSFVERALERETRLAPQVSGRLSEIARDMDWYDANQLDLLKRYEGEYVAIVDGAVVDHDEDAAALATRIAERYSTRSVYMPRCQSFPRVVNVRSPRIAR